MKSSYAWLLAIMALLPVARADEAVPSVAAAGTVFVSGVEEPFTAVREAVEQAKAKSGRDYRVVVVDSAAAAGDARGLLDRIVAEWRRDEESGFDPAADVTIVLAVGDRRMAMDMPWALEVGSGLDRETLERELIQKVFVPRAKDGLYDQGLADLVAATETWVATRADEQKARVEAARVFRTRTLPIGLAGMAGAGLLGALAVQWARHGRKLRRAREKLATFKSEVVALSDLLDAEQERHRMLPHTDPDFQTPMEGQTRAAYDDVQAAIRRYRERWLGLMDVWEKAQQTVESEHFMGTRAADEAIRDLVRHREPRRVKIEDIQRLVANHYNVSRADILSSRRTATVVRPRQIAMYLAKSLTLRSLPEIGRRFGGRDHTTVLHAVRKIEGMVTTDQELAGEIDHLKRMLQE
jgi:hypothetical protein